VCPCAAPRSHSLELSKTRCPATLCRRTVGSSRVWRRRSSERLCTAEVRENAREVCVARWYDPSTGQFMSVDPDLAETDQPYAYAGDDPVNETDPRGKTPWPPDGYPWPVYCYWPGINCEQTPNEWIGPRAEADFEGWVQNWTTTEAPWSATVRQYWVYNLAGSLRKYDLYNAEWNAGAFAPSSGIEGQAWELKVGYQTVNGRNTYQINFDQALLRAGGAGYYTTSGDGGRPPANIGRISWWDQPGGPADIGVSIPLAIQLSAASIRTGGLFFAEVDFPEWPPSQGECPD
jgi:hypothetical protein